MNPRNDQQFCVTVVDMNDGISSQIEYLGEYLQNISHLGRKRRSNILVNIDKILMGCHVLGLFL